MAGERLGNYCLLRAMHNRAISLGVARMVDARLKNEGYSGGLGADLPYQARRVSFGFSVSPVVTWSSNINGGNPQTELRLGSLVFQGDSQYTRKEGVLLGASASVGGRWLYGGGRYLNYSVAASQTRSPAHDLDVRWGVARLCSLNHIRNWWYADGCYSGNRSIVEISNSTTKNSSFGVVKLLTLPADSHHELGLHVKRLFDDGSYRHKRHELSLNSIHAGGLLYTHLNLTRGERIENRLTMRRSTAAKLGMRLLNRPLTVGVTLSESTGGRFLGFSRNETSRVVSASYPLWNFSLTIGHRKTDSLIDYYDASEPILGIGFPPLRF